MMIPKGLMVDVRPEPTVPIIRPLMYDQDRELILWEQ